MKLYKLTDQNGQTFNKTQWGVNIRHEAIGNGKELCTNGWIHAYESPLLAVLLNPIHANFKSPRLWEAEGEVGICQGQLKCGCKILTTLREIPLPEVTITQRIEFAIHCALEVYSEKTFVDWASDWLSNTNRTAASAEAAAAAEWSAAAAAAEWSAAAAAASARAEAASARAEAAAAAAAEWSAAAAAASARAEAAAAAA